MAKSLLLRLTIVFVAVSLIAGVGYTFWGTSAVESQVRKIVDGSKETSAPPVPEPALDIGLRMRIEPSKTEVLPFEPTWATVYLENESLQPESLTDSFQLFRFVRPVSGEWRIYYPDNFPNIKPPPPRTLVFQPGEVKTWITYFEFDARAQGEHVFAKPGTVQLKVSLGQIESPAVTITVISPLGEDALAYESLKQSNLARYFADETLKRYPFDIQTVAEVEEFIQKFPGSKYREYAQLGLALMWIQGVEGVVDLTKANSLLTDLSTGAGENMAARARYYLAIIAQEEGQSTVAEQIYRSIIEEVSDPYLEHLARQQIEALEGQTALAPAAIHAPVDGALRLEIEAVLYGYLNAIEQQDMEGALGRLNETFLYNDALDKNLMSAKLGRDFAEIGALTGQFSIGRSITELELEDGQPVAEMELSMILDGNTLSPPRKVRIGLVQNSAGWFIETWHVLS